MTTPSPGGIRDLLRRTLTERMRARDRDAVAAIRAALAAIDNAEAVPVDRVTPPPPTVVGSADVVTPHVGVGSAEAERRALTEEHMRSLVAAEADEREGLSRRLGELGGSGATGGAGPAGVAFEQAAMLRFLLDVAERG